MASFEEGKSYLRLAKPLSGHTDSIDSTLQVSDTRYRVTAEETGKTSHVYGKQKLAI